MRKIFETLLCVDLNYATYVNFFDNIVSNTPVRFSKFNWNSQDVIENIICVLEPLYTTNIADSIVTALKFLTLIAMLIFIRGGIPRYRYDFLTKIGWIKFLSLILSVFLTLLLSIYVI